MKTPSFKPKKITNHGKECWKIDIPANYSPTRKRKRPIYATKAEAERDSRKLRSQVSRFGNQLPPIPHDLHAVVVEALKILEPHGIGLERAVAEYVQRLEKSQSSITYKELVDRVVDHKRDLGKRPVYVSDVRQKGRHFLPFFGENKICEIETLEIDEAIASLQISPSSKQIYRRYLRMFFNQALEWNLIERNPVPPNKKGQIYRKEPKIFSVDQVTRLLKGATSELLPYYTLAVFCGIRPVEITRLNWEDIDFEKRIIELSTDQSKTHERRMIKVEDTPFSWLAQFKGKTGSIVPSSFRAKFDANRKASGLFSEWSSDVLRHTCATYHATFHENFEKTSFMLGHDVRTLKNFYFRPVLDEAAEEFWAITPDSIKAAKRQQSDDAAPSRGAKTP